MPLDNAEFITIDVVEHIDEVSSSGGKQKRTLGITCATDLLDESVYETMNDYSTREFIFVVKPAEIPEGLVEVVKQVYGSQSCTMPYHDYDPSTPEYTR